MNRQNQNQNHSKESHSLWGRLSAWVNGEEVQRDTQQEIHPEVWESRKNTDVQPTVGETGETIRRLRGFRRFYIVACVGIGIILVSLLLFVCSQMPPFGEVDVPTNNEVTQKYIEDGLEDTGATNLVAGIILDYRAFDTLGESSVLFTAVMSVLILLKKDGGNGGGKGGGTGDVSEESRQLAAEARFSRESPNIVMKCVSLILIPIILLFGIYVVLNGHISPGGGFSGGAMMGGGLILYATAYGPESVKRFFNFKLFTGVTSGALLAYACMKIYSFYTGANHIPSLMPLGTPGDILSGVFILPLNVCVGMIVACNMYGFYYLYTRGEI